MANTYKIKNWFVKPTFTALNAIKRNVAPSTVYHFANGVFKPWFKVTKFKQNQGALTGKGVLMQSGIKYFLVRFKTAVGGEQYGYVTLTEWDFIAINRKSTAQDTANAQAMANAIIANDTATYAKCKAQYQAILELEAKGIVVPAKNKQAVNGVLGHLIVRQNDIVACPFIATSKQRVNGIGVIPVVVIVGAIVVMAVTAWLAYNYLFPLFDASKVHSQYLDDNEAELRALLGDEKYNELNKNVNAEMKDQATDAYQSGSRESTNDTMKILLLVGLGMVAMKQLQK